LFLFLAIASSTAFNCLSNSSRRDDVVDAAAAPDFLIFSAGILTGGGDDAWRFFDSVIGFPSPLLDFEFFSVSLIGRFYVVVFNASIAFALIANAKSTPDLRDGGEILSLELELDDDESESLDELPVLEPDDEREDFRLCFTLANAAASFLVRPSTLDDEGAGGFCAPTLIIPGDTAFFLGAGGFIKAALSFAAFRSETITDGETPWRPRPLTSSTFLPTTCLRLSPPAAALRDMWRGDLGDLERAELLEDLEELRDDEELE